MINTKKDTLKPTGVPTYKRKFLNLMGKTVGDFELRKLQQMDVQTAVTSLVEKKYRFKTIRDSVAILKLCCDAAVGNGLIKVNPCLGVIVPNYDQITEERRVLTEEEQKILLDYTKGTFYEELYKGWLMG